MKDDNIYELSFSTRLENNSIMDEEKPFTSEDAIDRVNKTLDCLDEVSETVLLELELDVLNPRLQNMRSYSRFTAEEKKAIESTEFYKELVKECGIRKVN